VSFQPFKSSSREHRQMEAWDSKNKGKSTKLRNRDRHVVRVGNEDSNAIDPF